MKLWKLVENRGDLPAIDTIGSHLLKSCSADVFILTLLG